MSCFHSVVLLQQLSSRKILIFCPFRLKHKERISESATVVNLDGQTDGWSASSGKQALISFSCLDLFMLLMDFIPFSLGYTVDQRCQNWPTRGSDLARKMSLTT